MYNLTVAGAHTFFVGAGQWLVHNCNPGDPPIDDLIEGATPGRETKGKAVQYERTGGADQALQDFQELNLQNVRTSGNTLIGDLPDGRTVNFRIQSSDGRPTIEVKTPGTSKVLKFRYSP